MTEAKRSSKGMEVFVSYSHKDEDLRAELEKHLTVLSLRGLISTWHDRKILAGDEWKGEIDEHLNSAQIILLLISSDFMASDYCRDIEMKLAMEKHDSGEACVIPLILRHVYWKGAPFSKLQPLPTNGNPIKDGNWKSLDAAFTDVAKGLEKTIEGFAPRQKDIDPNPSQNSKSFRTIVVDQMNRADYATISEAVGAAKPGDRILIYPGLYEERLEIDKPLEIIGKGKKVDIEIRAKGMPTLEFKAPIGRITNLSLQQLDNEVFCCIDMACGRLTLEGCDISSQSKFGIAIHKAADPRLKGNSIHDCSGVGVIVFDNGLGILEENDIFGNKAAGVAISDGCNPILRNNRIYNGKDDGVWVYNKGQGILEDNDIFANEGSGIAISDGGNPILRNNRIHDCKDNGVWVYNKGQGTLKDNDIFANEGSGIAISDGGNPILRNNRIHDGKDGGVWIFDNGQGTLENNDIFANNKSGVTISSGSNPTLRLNRIYNSKNHGLFFHDDGNGVIEYNEISSNNYSGIRIIESSGPIIKNNRINKNGFEGIWVSNEGAGEIEDNDIRDNGRGPWDISEDSKNLVKVARNLEK